MPKHEWIKEFPGVITICDEYGIIIEMNDKSIKSNEKDGGEKLIGTNILDCHPEPSKSKLKEMMEERITKIYTTERKGVKEFIYLAPWYKEGKYMGFMEFSMEIPFDMSHFIRE